MKRKGRLVKTLPSVLCSKHGAEDDQESSPESWRRDSGQRSGACQIT